MSSYASLVVRGSRLLSFRNEVDPTILFRPLRALPARLVAGQKVAADWMGSLSAR
jgi:hypothetical protein